MLPAPKRAVATSAVNKDGCAEAYPSRVFRDGYGTFFGKGLRERKTSWLKDLRQTRTNRRCQCAKLFACQNIEACLRHRQFRQGASAIDSFKRCVPFRGIETPGLMSLPDRVDGRRHGLPVMTQHSDVGTSAKCFNRGFAR